MHSCAIDNQGRLYTWGDASCFKLGHLNHLKRYFLFPTLVEGI